VGLKLARKWGPCAAPRCPALTDQTHCEMHRPKPWASSNRKARLPGDWHKLRAAVLARDRHTCYLCGAYANRVDHVIAGDNHDPANLAAICLDCDKHKSGQEGGRASWRYR
jgi:5-methylcytosine-specific restriction enzyme A